MHGAAKTPPEAPPGQPSAHFYKHFPVLILDLRLIL